MAGYAIIRVEKHSTLGTIAGIGHHLDRTRETPNAAPERAHLNRTWSDGRWVEWGDEPRQPGSHLRAFQERLADFQQRGGKIQANAVIALEVLLSASPEAFRAPGFDFEGWLAAQAEYVAKRFGERNIVSVVLHLDEETPHVHAIVIPEIERIERRGNKKTTKPQAPKPPKPALAASHWVDGRAKLAALQTDYGAAMSRFGLQRGKERSGARHVPVSEYYAQGAALVAQIEHLQAEVERLRPAAERLPEVEQQLAEAHALIDSLQASRAEQRSRIERMRAARRADAEDLGVIRTIKEALPGVYQEVVGMADREMARRAEAEIVRMSAPAEPDEPGPRP